MILPARAAKGGSNGSARLGPVPALRLGPCFRTDAGGYAGGLRLCASYARGNGANEGVARRHADSATLGGHPSVWLTAFPERRTVPRVKSRRRPWVWCRAPVIVSHQFSKMSALCAAAP